MYRNLEKKNRYFRLFILVIIIAIIIIILRIPSTAPSNESKCQWFGPRQWIKDEQDQWNFDIRTTWNGQCFDHEPVRISLSPAANGDVNVKVYAHFFDSPAKPDGPSGQPFPQLWDYEVVEVFFLNDNDQYVEVELNPHGQHLVLLLNGRRKMVKDQLPLMFQSTIAETGDRWLGQATIPRSYFPPGVTKFNAYAIHGEGKDRQYQSLFPVTNPTADDQPDFHRLEFFQAIDMNAIMNDYDPSEVSPLWKSILENSNKEEAL